MKPGSGKIMSVLAAFCLVVVFASGCGDSKELKSQKANFDNLQTDYQRLQKVEQEQSRENADLKQKLTQAELRIKYLEEQLEVLKKGGGPGK